MIDPPTLLIVDMHDTANLESIRLLPRGLLFVAGEQLIEPLPLK